VPEKVDALLLALLADRPLCWDCVTVRTGLTREGATAAIDHLRQTTQVIVRNPDRCRACGLIGETVSIDRPVTWAHRH
jgi:hypothetical protein